jgi:hypothetical protein
MHYNSPTSPTLRASEIPQKMFPEVTPPGGKEGKGRREWKGNGKELREGREREIIKAEGLTS